jgi:hypothetical protein
LAIAFWQGETEMQSRRRQRILKKAVEAEKDYCELRKNTARSLQSAKGKLEAAKTELRRAKYKLLKAKCGFM